ncbi:Ig domain-containing protein [Paenibacillus sp. NEAU-GSW1]|uniref:Ig-like domain-containing protein n=1 Tax=Paenibacillus sp. NEAU-GSW1 TaxID=2682486 RepID=UPI0012E2432A|nr:S-layer homology domain-containing protein [Paenibacillus sp. NEAU-GSW1]MUT65036.1 hypothetical protein [Paenibacillus sp. NEAU-GSW1]
MAADIIYTNSAQLWEGGESAMRESSNTLSNQHSQQPKVFRGGEKKVMKKSLSFLVAIALVFSMFTSAAFAADTTKTTEQKYNELVTAGVFNGFPDGQAHLDQTMTRAEAAKIIAILAGYKAGVTSPDAGFTDVVAGNWAKPYIDYAANLGIIQGVGNGIFDFNAQVTIQELAKLAVEALKALKVNVPAGEAVTGTVSDWAKDYVAAAVKAGLIPAQADYTVPASRELLVVASYFAYSALQQPTEIKVESVKAINKKTVVATFNVDVDAATKEDAFKVYTKGNQYALNYVDSVSVSGKTVTATLVDDLNDETTYVLATSGVKAAGLELTSAAATNEFTYAPQAAASIAFKSTTVADGDTVPVLVKDAAGNDISADFEIGDFDVESSDEGVVGTDLKAVNDDDADDAPEYAVVNVKLVDTKLETGNTIITVRETLQQPASIGVVTLENNFTKNDLELNKGETDTIIAQVLDKDGEDVDAPEITFTSQTPKVVSVDAELHTIKGISVGTATILVKAVYNGSTIYKTVTVTVKEAPKLTAIKVTAPASKLVIDSDIPQYVDVTLVDQYGNDYASDGTDSFNYQINKNNIALDENEVAIPQNTESADVNFANTKATASIKLLPGTVKGSATFKVSVNGTYTKSVTVSLVEKGEFAGYVAVASKTDLDINTADDAEADTAKITVYKKDKNGNYYADVTAAAGTLGVVELVEAEGNASGAINTNTTDEVTARAIGTENVVVKVDSAKVATLTFKVKNTTAGEVNKVVQSKSTLTVTTAETDLFTKLFGDATDGKGGAFVAYDQYGTRVVVEEADVAEINSSNKAIVDQDTLDVGKAGSVTLTIDVAGAIYTITVVVKEA